MGYGGQGVIVDRFEGGRFGLCGVLLLSCVVGGCHHVISPSEVETPDSSLTDVEGERQRSEDADGGADAAAPDDAGDVGTVDAEPDVASSPPEGPVLAPGGADVSAEGLDRVLNALRTATSAGARDAILREVAWQAGWPLSDGTRVLFATRWDEVTADAQVVGDFNGWAAGDAIAESSPPHHWVVHPVPTALAGLKYKWRGEVDGRVSYRAGPEATRYGYDDFGAFGYLRAPTDRRYLERYPDLTSDALPLGRMVRLSLPAGFVGGGSPRVLLMHDGQNVFAPDAPHGGWDVMGALDRAGYEDVVVLAVDSVADRREVYTHIPEDLSPDDGRVNPEGGRADDYLALLRDELLPWFEGHYGVTVSASRTLVAGSSLAGLVSLYLVRRAPALFGHVIAMSPAVAWGRLLNDDGTALADTWPERVGLLPRGIYLDSGGGVPQGRSDCADRSKVDYRALVDADFYCSTRDFRETLLGLGYVQGVDLSYVHRPGAPHNESSWRVRLPGALDAAQRMGW